MDAIARITIPRIEATAPPRWCSWTASGGDYEVETFKEHFPGFTLIGIESSFETRYRRLTNRGRSDDSLTPPKNSGPATSGNSGGARARP